MKVSNTTYDIIKLVALIIAPVVTFITAIINIWGIPYGDQIVASLVAFDVLCGSLVAILKAIYDKQTGGEKK